jgi:hypothetical protein
MAPSATRKVTVILPIKLGITLKVNIGMRIMVAIAAARASSGFFSIRSLPFSFCDNKRDDESECGEWETSLSELEIMEEETSYEVEDI